MGGLGDIIAATYGRDADLYGIFGVKKEASEAEIKKAYHKLALKVGWGGGRGDGGEERSLLL